MSIEFNENLTALEKYNMIRTEIFDNIFKNSKNVQSMLSTIPTTSIYIDDKKIKLKSIIEFYTKFLDSYNPSISERFYYIYHDIQELVTCKYCKKVKPKFRSFNVGYRTFCSNECSVHSRQPISKNKSQNKIKTKPTNKLKSKPISDNNEVITHNKLENKSFKDFIPFLIKYDVKYETNYKEITPYNLDIYIPEHKIAIELNSIFKDTELSGKTKYYFSKKKKYFLDNNIQILNIFEDEWITTPNIIKSMILNKLKLSPKRIYARKCKIDIVDSKKAKLFLNTHHVQGGIHSKYCFGLYYNRQLVSLLTVGASRYNQNYKYELHRFCSYLGHNVIGGFSKLLKFAIKYLDMNSLITYADLRLGDGNVYEKNGFDYIGCSQPNYFYVKGNELKRSSRVQFQKHKLNDRLEYFDDNETEWENMQKNGYDRIWDCGNACYGLKTE